MKKILILFLAAIAVLSTVSCEKWLDIQPSDTIREEDLFKEGTGYRNALNGIYRQLSATSLYGRELTWGAADVMGQIYDVSRMVRGHVYRDLASYNYTTKDAKDLISGIWGTTYKAIANTNNLIGQIETAADSKFKGGKLEREMILGEAHALRGMLHFDMLCYFAPAPSAKHDGYWIPYYEKFPSTGADYLTVEGVLERVVRDLKCGYELVEPFDSYENGVVKHCYLLGPDGRFTNNPHGQSYQQPSDLFYAFRGYRLHSMAITALLARVYNYAGEYDLAAQEAQKVMEHIWYPPYTSYLSFQLCGSTDVISDHKLTKELIFTLSNPQLIDDYYQYAIASNSSLKIATKYNNAGGKSAMFDSPNDFRWKTLLTPSGNQFLPKRYTKPTATGSMTEASLDMLPVIRLSELYFIQAENFADKGKFTDAIAKLEAVRAMRGCLPNALDSKITDWTSFVNELLAEVQREFIEEGRTFFYFKKYNRKLVSSMKNESFYFPLPENETIH